MKYFELGLKFLMYLVFSITVGALNNNQFITIFVDQQRRRDPLKDSFHSLTFTPCYPSSASSTPCYPYLVIHLSTCQHFLAQFIEAHFLRICCSNFHAEARNFVSPKPKVDDKHAHYEVQREVAVSCKLQVV